MFSSSIKWSVPVAVVAAAGLFGSLVEARPDGATVCQMSQDILTRMVNNGAMGPMNTKLAISVKAAAAYTPSAGPMSIQVTSAAPIQGIVLYAENSAGSHVGSFAAPAGYKSLNIPACKNEIATSSLTHANPTPKGNTTTFQWTPPKEGQGALNLRALVVTNTKDGFNMGSFQVTGPGTAKDFSSATTPSTTAGSGASTPALSFILLAASIAGSSLARI